MSAQAIEYADASAQVRAVYDDIKKTRNVPDVNNFWKYLARDPAMLGSIKGQDYTKVVVALAIVVGMLLVTVFHNHSLAVFCQAR